MAISTVFDKETELSFKSSEFTFKNKKKLQCKHKLEKGKEFKRNRIIEVFTVGKEKKRCTNSENQCGKIKIKKNPRRVNVGT